MSKFKPIALAQSTFLCGKSYPPHTDQSFAQAFQSIVWVSYRSSITALAKCLGIPADCRHHKNDAGWGCMIRFSSSLTHSASQMLLANCLIKAAFADNKFSLELVDADETTRLKYLYVLQQ